MIADEYVGECSCGYPLIWRRGGPWCFVFGSHGEASFDPSPAPVAEQEPKVKPERPLHPLIALLCPPRDMDEVRAQRERARDRQRERRAQAKARDEARS